MIVTVLHTIAWVAVAYLVLAAASQTVIAASAAASLRTHHLTTMGDRRRRMLSSPLTPPISILTPARNEETTVVDTATSLLALEYPRLEVVVVNDGSTDGTLDALRRAFSLKRVHTVHRNTIATAPLLALYRSPTFPGLLVVDKDRGGKADSLNAGLNCASGDLVCVTRADTLVEPDALLKMVGAFLSRDDVVAAGGTIGVVNACDVSHGRVTNVGIPRRFLAGTQVVEYMRSFLLARLGWNRLGGNLIISGAFGLFRREAVIDVGGYETGSSSEDMELVVALRRQARRMGTAGRVEFVPDLVAWSVAPETVNGVRRQRNRWQRGLAEVLRRHSGMLGNPRSGALGMVVAPYFLLIELLAPVAEVAGAIAIVLGLTVGAVDPQMALAFVLVTYGFGTLLNLTAVILEQAGFDSYRNRTDKAWLVLWAFAEGLVLRPLVVTWRLHGLWRFARGSRDWGTLHPRGLSQPTSTVEPAALPA